jgi:hypothetical protein
MAKGVSMKWEKFKELEKKHPYVAHDLVWRSEIKGNLKEFVRTKVGFIAHRPFEKLDLSSTGVSSVEELNSNFLHARMERYVETAYQISAHVEGEAESSRLRYVSAGKHVPDGTIQGHIESLLNWFQDCKNYNGKQLVFERVVKRTLSGSSHCGLTNMNLEIYPFPPRYRFRPIERPPLPRPDQAMVAFLSGGPMPPIVPGSLGFEKR